MLINELAGRAGVPAKTIRYYESIRLLPPPARRQNGYRQYSQEDVERLKLVAGARRLDLSLAEIGEILAMRDRGEAPCRVLLELIEQKADEINQRIAELERMEAELRQLHSLALTFPDDDVQGKRCVCHLVSEGAAAQEVPNQG